MNNEKTKTTKVFLLTYEEVERFDLLLSALRQAYWEMNVHRSILIPEIDQTKKTFQTEERFFALHRDLNEDIDF